MATTKRRDNDPVRVHPDGRVVYWTGGVPGEGKRVFTRPEPGQSAEELAAELRHDLGTPSLYKGGRQLVQLAEAYFAAHDPEESTTGKYLGNWHNYVLPTVGAVHCRDLGLADLLEVLEAGIDVDLMHNTITGIATSFQAVVTWGVARGWFGPTHPFGTREQRGAAVEELMRSAFDGEMAEEDDEPFTVETVPSPAEVEELAVRLEQRFPGCGHLVRLLAASGLRIAELVALRVEDVDLDRMVIRVRRQGRRNRDWCPGPPGTNGEHEWTRRLKGRRRREVQVWAHARASLAWLVEHAEHGWLVPPDRGQAKWLDALNRRINDGCADQGWDKRQRCHWLRHYYGTYSIAPAPTGYGLDPTDVSRWLGHCNVGVTQAMYVHSTHGAAARAVAATERGLG